MSEYSLQEESIFQLWQFYLPKAQYHFIHSTRELCDILTAMMNPNLEQFKLRVQDYLQESVNDQFLQIIPAAIGIAEHESLVLCEMFGTIANIACVDIQTLLSCPIEPRAARLVFDYFNEVD